MNLTINPDTYFGSALHLEGEQTKCEPRAACCSTSLSNFFTLTLARGNPPGEGAPSKSHATNLRPERMNPPDLLAEDLEESGGVSALTDSPILPGDLGSPGDPDSLGLACMVADADASEVGREVERLP